MNVYDSARMADVLAPLGYAPVDDPALADLVVLNTCHIREKAAEKVYSELGRLQHLQASAQAPAGGPAADRGRRLRRPGRGRRDPARARPSSTSSSARRPITACRSCSPRADARRRSRARDRLPGRSRSSICCPQPTAAAGACSAFLTVQEGCDKFCTFCVVPYTRGAEYSRPVADVWPRPGGWPPTASREITLLGQNVNAYHGATGRSGQAEWGLGGG